MAFFAITHADPGGDAAVFEVVAIGLVAGAVAGPLLLKRSLLLKGDPTRVVLPAATSLIAMIDARRLLSPLAWARAVEADEYAHSA
jgi:hypothetical protein